VVTLVLPGWSANSQFSVLPVRIATRVAPSL